LSHFVVRLLPRPRSYDYYSGPLLIQTSIIDILSGYLDYLDRFSINTHHTCTWFWAQSRTTPRRENMLQTNHFRFWKKRQMWR